MDALPKKKGERSEEENDEIADWLLSLNLPEHVFHGIPRQALTEP